MLSKWVSYECVSRDIVYFWTYTIHLDWILHSIHDRTSDARGHLPEHYWTGKTSIILKVKRLHTVTALA